MPDTRKDERPEHRDGKPFRMRLPGFVSGEETGLGDVVKRATAAVGIRPCGRCGQRAEALNRRLVLTGKRHR